MARFLVACAVFFSSLLAQAEENTPTFLLDRTLMTNRDFNVRDVGVMAISPDQKMIAFSGSQAVDSNGVPFQPGDKPSDEQRENMRAWLWIYKPDPANKTFDKDALLSECAIEGPHYVTSMFFLDNHRLVFSSGRGRVGIYDTDLRQVVIEKQIEGDRVNTVCCRYNGGGESTDAVIVTASQDHTIRLWSDQLELLESCSYVSTALVPQAIASCDGMVAIGDSDAVNLVWMDSHRQWKVDPGVPHWYTTCVDFVRAGKENSVHLVAGGAHMNSRKSRHYPGRVCVWDVSSFAEEDGAPVSFRGRRAGSSIKLPEPTHTLRGFAGSVADITSDSHGRIITAGGDLIIRIWDLDKDDRKPIVEMPFFPHRSGNPLGVSAEVAFFDGGLYMFAGSATEQLRVWHGSLNGPRTAALQD